MTQGDTTFQKCTRATQNTSAKRTRPAGRGLKTSLVQLFGNFSAHRHSQHCGSVNETNEPCSWCLFRFSNLKEAAALLLLRYSHKCLWSMHFTWSFILLEQFNTKRLTFEKNESEMTVRSELHFSWCCTFLEMWVSRLNNTCMHLTTSTI
jgi:hypothetical protein